jgi:hypothetical protein
MLNTNLLTFNVGRQTMACKISDLVSSQMDELETETKMTQTDAEIVYIHMRNDEEWLRLTEETTEKLDKAENDGAAKSSAAQTKKAAE